MLAEEHVNFPRVQMILSLVLSPVDKEAPISSVDVDDKPPPLVYHVDDRETRAVSPVDEEAPVSPVDDHVPLTPGIRQGMVLYRNNIHVDNAAG